MNTLFSKSLNFIGHYFGARCCDDLEKRFIVDFTRQEINQMAKDFHKYNGDPQCYEEGAELSLSIVFFLFSYYVKENIPLTEKQEILLEKLLEYYEP